MFAFWTISMLLGVLCSGITSWKVQIDKGNILLLEVGKMVDLRCDVSGCPEQPSFTWRTVNDVPFKPVKEENGFISFKTEALTNIQLLCVATCNGSTSQGKIKIVVYSFPSDPEIFGEDNLIAGVLKNLTCRAQNLYPPDDVLVEWKHGNRTVLDEEPGIREDATTGKSVVSSEYTFIPTAGDNGTNVTCKVIQIPPGFDRKLQNNRTWSVPLTVNLDSGTTFLKSHPVYLGNIRISGQRNVTIGETLNLTCNTEGNPRPMTQWTKAGNVLDSNDGTIAIRNITWSDAGLYYCEANNTANTVKSNVTVIIQGPPSGAQVRVFPSAELLSGQNVTITCTVLHSIPPATFTLFRPEHSQPLQSGHDGTFHLPHLTDKDTGLYLINITNHLGYTLETVQLSIASSSALPPAVLPTVGSMSFLTALLLLLRFLRSRKRSGDMSTGIADVVDTVL